MNIFSLFPIPVAKFNLGRDLTAEESKFLDEQETRKNVGNVTSTNYYVLTNESMADLYEFVKSCVATYLKEIYAPKHDVSLRVTQSWFNYSKPGEWHHKHAHPNSFVSGVLYMKAVKTSDRIYFHNKDEYKPIDLPTNNFNLYNSSSWWIPVEAGDLVLFPSSLPHHVEPVQAEETRVSLAFNTFPVGYAGQEDNLTALHLRD